MQKGFFFFQLMTMPTLRTDFTLPVSSINPISMPSFPVKANPKAINSIPMSSSHTDNSPVKFTFSTPIQKSQGARDSLNTNGKVSDHLGLGYNSRCIHFLDFEKTSIFKCLIFEIQYEIDKKRYLKQILNHIQRKC